MENIFIDTSIFMKENFLEGQRMRQLLRLGYVNQIQIILTRITVNEVKNRFKKSIEAYRAQMKKYNAFRNIPESKKFHKRLMTDDISTLFNKKLDHELALAKALIIEDQTIDLSEIMDAYFNTKPPFSKKKKSEFPDAITIFLLEKWCSDNEEKINTFSTDPDFEFYKSTSLFHQKSYEDYIDEKLKDLYNSRINKLDSIYKLNTAKFDQHIIDWYTEELYDESLYYPFIYLDIHDIEKPKVKVLDKDYQIIFVNEETIEIEITAEVSIKVNLEIDDEEFSYYDDEEKVVTYYGTKMKSIDRILKAKVIASAYIENDEEYDNEIEVLSINKDKKLNIEPKNDYR